MSVAKKDKKIILQKPNLVEDGAGGWKTPQGEDKYLSVATVWAEAWKPKTVTAQATGTMLSELTRNHVIWRRSDVKKGWRVLYKTHIYSVEHAYDYEKNETMVVCKEVVR